MNARFIRVECPKDWAPDIDAALSEAGEFDGHSATTSRGINESIQIVVALLASSAALAAAVDSLVTSISRRRDSTISVTIQKGEGQSMTITKTSNSSAVDDLLQRYLAESSSPITVRLREKSEQ